MAKEGGRVVVPEIGAAVQGAGVQMPAHMILPVQASGEAMQGRYTNMAVINHTGREFVVDFFFTREGLNMLVSRVITSPAHAKALHRVLGNNIEGYEKKYGEIKE